MALCDICYVPYPKIYYPPNCLPTGHHPYSSQGTQTKDTKPQKRLINVKRPKMAPEDVKGETLMNVPSEENC